MENAVKFLVNFAVPLSSGNEDRKCPEFFTTNFTPFFTRRFAAANAQFHGVFSLCRRLSLRLWREDFAVRFDPPGESTFAPLFGVL